MRQKRSKGVAINLYQVRMSFRSGSPMPCALVHVALPNNSSPTLSSVWSLQGRMQNHVLSGAFDLRTENHNILGCSTLILNCVAELRRKHMKQILFRLVFLKSIVILHSSQNVPACVLII